MSFLELARRIPLELQGKSANALIDLILNSPNAPMLSISLARSILHHWQRDQLTTESGLSILVEASLLLEPQKTSETFSGLGLGEVAEALRARVQP